ncbi:centrosomal protein of 112 kDa-like isoform X1 [Thalassophryne amazonica]|uniref:centrosomal protein of 112 kDa-like isoform X1 n=1 Tax=Thalassophryne amazonica TaxID=390379 RepID=UPI001472511F|nr:centrosomal protein of 112 kDa-like isoform X1 [Thalassophryne amazonica]
MMKNEDSLEKLDTEFNNFLADIKPVVLKHPNKTERQLCAVWIRKLCDPVTCGSGVIGRAKRNTYARVLLHMLKKGALEWPFTSRPEPGSLNTLPTYMTIYFDEPLSGRSVDHSHVGPPDWVTGELDDDSLTVGMFTDRTISTPNAAQFRKRLSEEKSPSRPMTSSPLKHSLRHDARMVDMGPKADMSPDDSDLEAGLNSWNLGIENPRYLREKSVPLSPISKSSSRRNNTLIEDQGPLFVHSKETELKMKILESRYQEEKLKMQQNHDADVQKIIERKNGEMEDLKNMYRAKLEEAEEMIRKLEKKVQSLLLESQVFCESKDKQIAELKKMSDLSTESLKNEWEKKLHAAVTEMEQEKMELLKKHTKNIQELLDDTNQSLVKMEAEYSARSQAAEQMVRELDVQLKHQLVEVEKGNALCQKLTQEKAQLESHIASLSAELQEASRRSVVLLKEKEQQREQHEQTVRRLQAKHEMDMNHFQQEHTLSAAKASEVIDDLEKTISQLREQLQTSEQKRHKQIREQEISFQQEKDELQVSCEKKVLAIRSEAEKERAEAKKKIAKLEEAFRETESLLNLDRENHRQQIQQAEIALKLKKQVELDSEKTCADMKVQMQKIKKDLICSQSFRENLVKDFSQQLNTVRQQYEQQMAEQRMQYEQERTQLQQKHSAEKDSLEREARTALQQHQQHTQEWRKRDAQRFSDLEAQLSSLREELQAAHVQRKEQLAEMTLLREEEKQRAALDKEASLDRLRTDMECIRSEAERKHQQDKDAVLEKTNNRWKQIEKDYREKLAKSAQLIAELQMSACSSKEEVNHLQQTLKKKLEEANNQWDQERRRITHNADQANEVLQKKAENLQRQLQSSEKKLRNKELETEEQVTAVRQEYEDKIKGLIPAELRQQLEDTISSLKTQVHFHQKRASMLQEDLDACRTTR